MTKIDGLDYSSEELIYFEKEMRAYRLPKYVKFWKRFGIPFIKYTILPAVILVIVLGSVYMSPKNFGQWDWAWVVSKSIVLSYIAGFGLWTMTSHITELISVNRLRKRLGLSQTDFNLLVIAFQITGM